MPTLPTRQLGKNGPQITGLGYGMMGLSYAYGTPMPDSQRFALLDALYDLGELHWDSADLYGDNELLLGKWFAANPGKRDNIFLTTKFGIRFYEDGSRGTDSSPEYLRAACEASLKRFGLPSVDLYYCHRQDGKTPIELTVREMAKLKAEGKIKYLGLSECSADTLRRAHKEHPISAVQMEYSPFSLEVEREDLGNLLKVARELGVALVAYSPIGRGMITGTIRSPDDFEEGDFRKAAPRFSKENFPKNLELVDTIGEIAKRKGVTISQLTLAWLLAQGDDVIPIPGTTKIERLKENLGALEVKLTKDEEKEIRDAVERAEVKGTRYPQAAMGGLFKDTPPLQE